MPTRPKPDPFLPILSERVSGGVIRIVEAKLLYPSPCAFSRSLPVNCQACRTMLIFPSLRTRVHRTRFHFTPLSTGAGLQPSTTYREWNNRVQIICKRFRTRCSSVRRMLWCGRKRVLTGISIIGILSATESSFDASQSRAPEHRSICRYCSL
jgi:hypothetical protein